MDKNYRTFGIDPSKKKYWVPTSEFEFRKKLSPIWSVKTSFCQKWYVSLYDCYIAGSREIY